MAESAKNVAQQTEDRLGQVAEDVRTRFDALVEGRFSEKIKEGWFADSGDSGNDPGHQADQNQDPR